MKGSESKVACIIKYKIDSIITSLNTKFVILKFL